METDPEPDPGPKGTATIFEVAEAAGVSITTVSHVFSAKRPVNEDTRRRVVEAAEELDYKPRASARALATGRTMTLAVQFPAPTPELIFNPYFAALLPALSEAAVARGYAFVLVPPDPAHDAFLAPLIGRRTVDAAILLDPVYGDPLPAALAEAEIPFVSLGRVPGMPERPRVDQDHPAAMAAVVRHLRAQGYERLAFINLPGEMTTLIDIAAAFVANVDDAVVVTTPDHSDDGADATAERLLSDFASPPDAIVCLTERQAAGVYRAAARLDVAIPEELGVVALGDSAMARSMRPALTSLSLFPEQAGHVLVELTDRLLTVGEAPAVTLLPTELLPRASTARRAS